MNSNGIITAPVRIQEDVSPVLGVSSTNLSVLCTSDKINKWSKYKPVRHSSTAKLTEPERVFVNHGFDVQGAHSMDIVTLVNKASTNDDWVYLKPRGGSYDECYRLGDFDKYNSNAGTMFSYTHIPKSIPTQGTSVGGTELRFTYNPSSELKPTDFGFVNNLGDNLHYAVAYYLNENDIRFAHGPSISTTGPIDIPITFPNLGDWKCLFILTKETGTTTEVMDSIYMPGGFFTISIYRVYIYADVRITNDYSNLWFDDNGIYGFYMPVLQLSCDKNFPTTTGTLELEVYCYGNGGTELCKFDVVDQNATFTYSGSDVSNFYIDFLSGGAINFSNYNLSGTDPSEIKSITMYATVKSVTGNGLFIMRGTSSWTMQR